MQEAPSVPLSLSPLASHPSPSLRAQPPDLIHISPTPCPASAQLPPSELPCNCFHHNPCHPPRGLIFHRVINPITSLPDSAPLLSPCCAQIKCGPFVPAHKAQSPLALPTSHTVCCPSAWHFCSGHLTLLSLRPVHFHFLLLYKLHKLCHQEIISIIYELYHVLFLPLLALLTFLLVALQVSNSEHDVSDLRLMLIQ